jgi:uncharacterized protein YwgA
MRDLDEMKLARVVDACDGIDGRVKMQKIVYFLTVMGYDLPYDDFTIRQQGPFSRAVACAADTLKGAEILQETTSELGPSCGGEPVLQYSYRVRDEVAPLIRQHFDVAAPAGKPPLEQVARQLKGHDRAVLEVAATRVFLDRESKLSGPNLKAELQRLKGHLSNRFDEADSLLKTLSERSWL